MTHQPSRLRATAIVECDKGILLTAMRSGGYLLPGGEVEPDESPLVGVIRELSEETGLIAESALFLFVHRSYSNSHHVFLVRALGTPQPMHEVRTLSYYQEGFTLNISQGTRDILRKYTEFKGRNADLLAGLSRIGTKEEAISTSTSLRRNTDSGFVGIVELKRKQAEQVAVFEQWAAQGDWQALHHNHFDWWMFPIDEASKFGTAYAVYAGDIAELKQDASYIRSYLRGVELLALAWGWDLMGCQYVAKPHPDQKWSDWAIRLYKAARSLQLFGYTDAFESLKTFALDLLRTGQRLQFNGKDLSQLFTKNQPR